MENGDRDTDDTDDNDDNEIDKPDLSQWGSENIKAPEAPEPSGPHLKIDQTTVTEKYITQARLKLEKIDGD